jgi:Rrf2 family protein
MNPVMNKHTTISGWFRVAVRGLVILAETGEICSSSAMARDLNAHAVFLRRIMAQLGQANIVLAREGRDGGYYLARPAECITLAEVYLAVKAATPHDEMTCPRGENESLQQALDGVAVEVEQCLLQALSNHTIASLMKRDTVDH